MGQTLTANIDPADATATYQWKVADSAGGSYSDIPEATIEIEFSTNLAEIMSQHDMFNEEELNKLKQDQSELVKKEAEKVIEYAQQYGVDIIKISDAIHHQHPLKWDDIKDNWKEVFKKMKINVKVESNVNRTYHIRQTIRSEKGK